MSSQPQASLSSSHFTTFPWGCKIMTDPVSEWPISATITHCRSTCECDRFGSEREIVRDFLIVVSYELYFRSDPEKYDCEWSGSILPLQAQRVGIDLDTLKAGFRKPIPWRKCFRRFDVVKVDGKLVSFPLPSQNWG
ncbi:hypothetical protein F5B21DRAFT_478406 [Xylaria acuta]|nr:hypothetical protein F5B21DRAFT_478406 [Xylaria acuta]